MRSIFLSFEPENRDVLQHNGRIDLWARSSRGYETCITGNKEGRAVLLLGLLILVSDSSRYDETFKT